ncbi:hypothetical protein TIFTF001_047674 [Ficus carica]|uniref:Disease resistance protein winged helix domain-containing protein n=1 Tax=Ficus carica TaxID=3494 RepID=A0AA88CPT6_FICCA|nr:hypothetical protein TIFTF001_047673 [Ficus carica]GMN24852.1 hypothetical protein TIFTF001_047674 [Ficus carica]
MRGKKRVELWKHALKELKGSVSCISGVKDKVYNSLKWSYDSLQGNNIKSCFLYCALYPEDFSIDVSELLQCWLAEGLIDDQQNFEEFVNNGVFVIETLKDACLLEDGSRVGTVKMHDVVRDVAIWIASSTEEKDSRSLVRSGIGLTEIQELDLSEDSVKRVSFMNNRISRLASCEAKRCSKASTLLLQGNPIREVPDTFLQRFPALKVLNVSRTDIWSLHSLLQLGELRAFVLQSSPYSYGLAPLGALVSLQVLDFHASSIATLPEEMGNLINLRQVKLSHTRKLDFIRAGVVSKWVRLEFLDMTASRYFWRTIQKAGKGEATLEELLSLEHLSCLSIVLDDFSCSDPEYLLTRIGRIRIFHVTLNWAAQRYVFTSGKHDKVKLTVNWYNDNRSWDPESMGWLLINATSMVWNGIEVQYLNFIILGLLSVRSVGRSSLVALKSLTINNVYRYSLISARGSDVPDLLPNLEELSLESITSLESISELVDGLGLKLYKLKTLLVFRCPQMKYLFSGENFSPQMPNLELMTVSICGKLEMLFDYNVVLPNLRILKLNSLTMLRDLCVPGESWPRLEKVYVFQCSLLRSLPLVIGNANSIQEIRGESQYWWSELKWDDEETKSRLQQCYNTTAQGRSGQYREGFEREDDNSFFRMCYSSGSYGMKTLI